MSYVIGYAYKNRIVIKSDGRVIDESNNSVLLETYNKTARLSDSLICGYTGCKNICELILNHFRIIYGVNPSKYNADTAIYVIKDLAYQVIGNIPDATVSFLIGGLNSQGLLTLNSFKSDSNECINFNPTSYEVVVTALEPKECINSTIHYLEEYILQENNIDSAADLTIQKVASESFSVNTNIYQQILIF